MPKLDLTNFEKTLSLLEKMINDGDKTEKDKLSIIQSFEFCYSQCIGIMKRYIQIYYAEKYNESIRLDDIIKYLYKEGITLSDYSHWDEFRETRNNTSHEYNHTNWNEFYQSVIKFSKEAKFVYKKLKTLEK